MHVFYVILHNILAGFRNSSWTYIGKTSRLLRVGIPKRDTGEFRRLGEHAYNFNINYYWPLLDTNNIFRQTFPVFYVILQNILAGFRNSSWTFLGKPRAHYELATLPFTTCRQPVYKVQDPTPCHPIYTIIGVYYDTNNIFRQTFPAFYVILYNISSGLRNQSLTYIGNIIFKHGNVKSSRTCHYKQLGFKFGRRPGYEIR